MCFPRRGILRLADFFGDAIAFGAQGFDFLQGLASAFVQPQDLIYEIGGIVAFPQGLAHALRLMAKQLQV